VGAGGKTSWAENRHLIRGLHKTGASRACAGRAQAEPDQVDQGRLRLIRRWLGRPPVANPDWPGLSGAAADHAGLHGPSAAKKRDEGGERHPAEPGPDWSLAPAVRRVGLNANDHTPPSAQLGLEQQPNARRAEPPRSAGQPWSKTSGADPNLQHGRGFHRADAPLIPPAIPPGRDTPTGLAGRVVHGLHSGAPPRDCSRCRADLAWLVPRG